MNDDSGSVIIDSFKQSKYNKIISFIFKALSTLFISLSALSLVKYVAGKKLRFQTELIPDFLFLDHDCLSVCSGPL